MTFSKPYIKESMADDSKDQQLDPQVHPALETKVLMNWSPHPYRVPNIIS